MGVKRYKKSSLVVRVEETWKRHVFTRKFQPPLVTCFFPQLLKTWKRPRIEKKT